MIMREVWERLDAPRQMANMPFDTMATARLLRESGIEERQAEAITTAIRNAVTGGVATKADISATKVDVAKLIAEIKTDLKWIKLIGAAVLVVLVLQRLADLVAMTAP